MRIELNHVMPFPLRDAQLATNSIWGQNVCLEPGERILLNAASGKGKSTFTFVVAGLRTDFSGSIQYDGEKIDSFSGEKWAGIRRERLSVVFQDLQLFPNLTVKENLALKTHLKSVFSESQLRDKLAMMGLSEKWEQKCGILSMGQQQRVAILRALNQPYEYLLMDEPFSHLDKNNAQICLNMIHERTEEQGAGFVLTTLGDHHEYQYSRELTL